MQQERRLKQVYIGPHTMLQALRPLIDLSDLPADIDVRSITFSIERGQWCLLVAHESFEELVDGAIPYVHGEPEWAR